MPASIDRKEEMGVTVKSVYDKLKGIETPVSRALVRDTNGTSLSVCTRDCC